MNNGSNLQIKKAEKRKKAKRLTMMVIPHTQGVEVKNYCIPMWLVKSFFAVSIACILIVGYFITGFFYLQYVTVENDELKAINTEQAREISELKILAGSMRDKLDALIKLDQEVRAKVGLTKASKDNTAVTIIDSSRTEERYQFMTMGLGAPGENMLQAQTAMVPYVESDTLNDDEYISTTTQSENIEQLAVMPSDDQIDTLKDLKEQLSQMDNMITIQAENMDKLNSDVDKRLAYLNALPNGWPIKGRITSGFGWRRNPFARSYKEFHDGLDIADAYGSPIRAAGAGVVTFAGYKSGWGNLVVISHGYGYVSQYAHNSRILVKVGQKVKRGDIISRMGSTGRSTATHVHFGIAKNGKWINPLSMLKS